MTASSVPQGIDRATLEAKRAEYDRERQNVEYTLLRIQGAIIALDELLASLAEKAEPVTE